jgi:hypothetical protein
VQRETDLFQVVKALGSAGGFTCHLDSRQQESNEDGDDGHHYE